MRRTVATSCLALLLAAGGGGCSYYKVTDPTSGKVYYTDGVWQPASMAAYFKDGRTGNQVTLQNTEIEKISQEEYDTGRLQPQPVAAAPALAPAAPAPAAAAPAPAGTPSASSASSTNVFQ